MYIKNIQINNINFKPIGNTVLSSLYQKQYQFDFDATVNSSSVQYSMLGNTILMTKSSFGYVTDNSWYSLIDKNTGNYSSAKVNSEDIRIFANLESPSDSAFYLGGVNKTVSGTNNILITKIDVNGNELWKTAYKIDDTKNSRINVMDLDSSGNIVAGGSAQDSDPNMNMMVCKFDKNTGSLSAMRLLKAPTTYRISCLKVDKTNNYVYFVAQEYTGTTIVANLIFGCLDNNLNTVWVKSTNATAEQIRGSNTFNLFGSPVSIEFINSNVVFVYRTADLAIVGVNEIRPIFLEMNKATGNIISQRTINNFTRFAFIKVENGNINYFGAVQLPGPIIQSFVTTITNWGGSAAFDGYYYNNNAMFGTPNTNIKGIVNKYDNYLLGYEVTGYGTIIKTNPDYTNPYSAAYTGSLTTLSTLVVADISVTNTNTLSSYVSVTPTYVWGDTTIL